MWRVYQIICTWWLWWLWCWMTRILTKRSLFPTFCLFKMKLIYYWSMHKTDSIGWLSVRKQWSFINICIVLVKQTLYTRLIFSKFPRNISVLRHKLWLGLTCKMNCCVREKLLVEINERGQREISLSKSGAKYSNSLGFFKTCFKVVFQDTATLLAWCNLTP